jgi:hypothetical protein
MKICGAAQDASLSFGRRKGQSSSVFFEEFSGGEFKRMAVLLQLVGRKVIPGF